ncbi:MAG: ATP-binding cassette domain-containing protein, partial [Myxococcales bacterium]|nr:ATP-binding cassette domain-containing protein [Myxococcales bacterium]
MDRPYQGSCDRGWGHRQIRRSGGPHPLRRSKAGQGRATFSRLGSVAPPLRVRELRKQYVDRRVLDDLSLEVAAGEAVALLGQNGAGKSTLLGCICGTVIPDAGTVEIAGHDLRSEPVQARRRLRYLPQEIDVPAGLTGRELLEFHAEVFAAPADLPQAVALADLGPALEM